MSFVRECKEQILKLQLQIEEVQNQCPHPKVAVKYEPKAGSSDGYSTDSYWYECHCGVCEKTWNEDQ